MKYHPLLRIVLLLLAALSLGGCAGMYFKDAGVPPPAEPRDPAHWPYREYWTGIVFNGAKIGFARLTLAPAADAPGRYDIDSEAVFLLRFLGLEAFCGHGIGKVFHDSPSVLHFGRKGTGPEIKPGMFFTVEPMINAGTWQVKILEDGWTAVTRDKKLSAQFEHTVGVTEDGVEIFTTSPTGLDLPPYAA